MLYLGRGMSNATTFGPHEVADKYGVPVDRAGEAFFGRLRDHLHRAPSKTFDAPGLVLKEAAVLAPLLILIFSAIVVRFSDGTRVAADVVGTLPDQDIALLMARRTELTAAVLGSSANLRVGDDVVAIGNAPTALFQPGMAAI